MNDHQLNTIEIDTFVLIKNGRAHVRSDAALEITKDLSGLWYLFNVFRIIPSPVRDFFYRLFARHRYQLFGRKDQCMIPDENLKARFLRNL
jgi:predicted DCC family thiol-disulfide oxidoreductase YuxK